MPPSTDPGGGVSLQRGELGDDTSLPSLEGLSLKEKCGARVGLRAAGRTPTSTRSSRRRMRTAKRSRVPTSGY